MTSQTKYDAAKYLTSEEAIAAFLKEILEKGDKHCIIRGLNDVIKARAVNQLAQDLGMDRKELWKIFAENGNPEETTLTRVTEAFVNLIPETVG
jgi:probable addiction module antidote protein